MDSRLDTALLERSLWFRPWRRIKGNVLPAAVIASWLSSRLFVDLILAIGAVGRAIPLRQMFSAWDGNWYQQIAHHGYTWANAIPADPADPLSPLQSAFPFFPLFPLLLALARHLGLPQVTFGLVVNHLCLLVGLALTHILVRRLSGMVAADWTCWFLAFSPGSLAYSLLYPEGLILVCSTGAFLAQGQSRYRMASLLAAIATLARPNGLILSLALAAEALSGGSRFRRVFGLLAPSLLVLLLWSACLRLISGNPLIWVEAKRAWGEVTLFNLHAAEGMFPSIQCAFGLVALALLLLGWSSQPWGWRLFGLLWIAPSFFIGMVGFPRYAGSCFPVFASLGDRATRLALSSRYLLLSLSAAALALHTIQVGVLRRWIP